MYEILIHINSSMYICIISYIIIIIYVIYIYISCIYYVWLYIHPGLFTSMWDLSVANTSLSFWSGTDFRCDLVFRFGFLFGGRVPMVTCNMGWMKAIKIENWSKSTVSLFCFSWPWWTPVFTLSFLWRRIQKPHTQIISNILKSHSRVQEKWNCPSTAIQNLKTA